MKKVKFSEIPVENIEGNIEKLNLCKELGNILYTQGKDVAICECGKKIYYGEEIELTEECKDLIHNVIANFPYIIRQAIEKLIN